MRKIAYLVVVGIAACGGGGSTEILCGEGATGLLASGGTVRVEGSAAQDLAGAAVTAQTLTTTPTAAITIACADDIVPTGYMALGPAVQITPDAAFSDRPFEITLPYKAARLPKEAAVRHVRVVVKRGKPADATPFFPAVSNLLVDDANRYASRASFRAAELATYQVVARIDAGQPAQRLYTYRGIAGVSMGGGAATAIGLRHHQMFDIIGTLGGEPGPNVVYTLDMLRDNHFGGFCTATQGVLGELCPQLQGPIATDQFEFRSDFEHLLFQPGQGVGLNLRRKLYVKASRDLSRALGNPALYNPDNPYLPPGIPDSWMDLDAATRCATPMVLTDFYDRDFNPDGTLPVITFCDGGDSATLGFGTFDPALAQPEPFEIMLAVDVNGNRVRDPGEPVVMNPYEPFDDFGADGLANVDEPGYDAGNNPDPNGDDYHYLVNPLGTERNRRFDAGETFEDVGIDGVAGTCQLPDNQVNAPCYDHGEGDGEWTVSPNVLRWYQNDGNIGLSALTEAERSRLSVWTDAGIRDFFNGHVASNGFVGHMFGLGMPTAVYDGFAPLTRVDNDAFYDFTKTPWAEIPKNVYVRYGNPDATASQIEAGDGMHVGTGRQIIDRITTLFAWINVAWPGGDRQIAPTTAQDFIDDTFISPTSGRDTPYSVFVPPGYYENTSMRYPTMYFLHGYGQTPEDLIAIAAIFSNYMVDSDRLEAERFQKLIIVFVDGQCRPRQDGVPTPPNGDGCEQGTFYMDAPASTTAKMETHMLELIDAVDANYRTKTQEMVTVVP